MKMKVVFIRLIFLPYSFYQRQKKKTKKFFCISFSFPSQFPFVFFLSHCLYVLLSSEKKENFFLISQCSPRAENTNLMLKIYRQKGKQAGSRLCGAIISLLNNSADGLGCGCAVNIYDFWGTNKKIK